MNLSDFATRVRRWLRDFDGVDYPLDTVIQPALDDFIAENYYLILKRCYTFYRKTEEYTGITDAVASTNNERYELPDDFYVGGNLRRSDLHDKPRLIYVNDPNDQQKHNYAYPFYDPDPAVPTLMHETWALYDDTHFSLIPAPTSSDWTYLMTYYRKWTEAVDPTDTVDLPDPALPWSIKQVALEILSSDDEPTVGDLINIAKISKEAFLNGDLMISSGVIPEVEKWWR